MTKRFDNYGELTEALVNAAIAALPLDTRGTLGFSNVSCSAYLTAAVDVIDEDGDEAVETFKLRFSDHDDRYGADKTVRFEGLVTALTDDFNEFAGVEIEDRHLDALVEQGVTAITEWRSSLREAA